MVSQQADIMQERKESCSNLKKSIVALEEALYNLEERINIAEIDRNNIIFPPNLKTESNPRGDLKEINQATIFDRLDLITTKLQSLTLRLKYISESL